MKTKTFASDNPVHGDTWVGIDASLTAFAICALDAQGEYYINVVSSDHRGVERLAEIRHHLNNFVSSAAPVTDIALESTVSHSQSASILGELSGVVKVTLWENHGVTPLLVPPMSLKRFACGKGNATKDLVMLSVYKRYGVEIPDNNAADAYVLARIARGDTIGKVEDEVLLKLADPKFR